MNGSLFLVQWHEPSARARAGELQAAGWQVAVEAEDGRRACDRIRARVPDVVVVDLSRWPAHGAATAGALRAAAPTRRVPIVFVDGDDAVVDRVSARVPDAVFTSWATLRDILRDLRCPAPAYHQHGADGA
jgi:DNA-binding NarL/FixJ family response regulator